MTDEWMVIVAGQQEQEELRRMSDEQISNYGGLDQVWEVHWITSMIAVGLIPTTILSVASRSKIYSWSRNHCQSVLLATHPRQAYEELARIPRQNEGRNVGSLQR